MGLEQYLKDIKETYLARRVHELRHRLTFRKHYKRMAQAMERFNSCSDRKSSAQIKKEMNICRKFWNCYPLHYYRYDLYKKDKEISERELLNYIPEFFFYSLFLPFYDSRTFLILLYDKSIMEQIFKGSIDSFAIMTGLNYKILSHRALPIEPRTISLWEQVWKDCTEEKKELSCVV